jgi:hypothetical protein
MSLEKRQIETQIQIGKAPKKRKLKTSNITEIRNRKQ